ncbi:uncharacterized protein MONOS_2706 [Monocercomonoides exilis]|uniref:uncharacterized protein n=1 Tax=Monocercomonoides exilis TaxID=2049356 RepID=UPI00355A2FA2|nr:hypothetical protein MONOS_2706 [Monocercomonoides exilis]
MSAGDEGIQEMNIVGKFLKLFDKLGGCNENEQKQKIEEMNGLIDEMSKGEFETISKTEMFDKIAEMIEEQKLSLSNALLLLKHMGYFKVLKGSCKCGFDGSSLKKIFEKIILEENNKKGGKNEKLWANICGCYVLLSCKPSPGFFCICKPFLLNAASVKEESEEVLKEVEMALLALSCTGFWQNFEKDLNLNEIKDIIKYHQIHRNLTPLAHQSAWKYMICRLNFENSLEGIMVNELHFAKEAAKELEELSKSVDWKRKDDKKEKETKEVLVIERWFGAIYDYFFSCTLRNEELAKLIASLVQMIRASRDNHKDICNGCLDSLRCAAENRNVEIDDLLKGGAVDAVLEEISQQSLNYWTYCCPEFFLKLSKRLQEEKKDEMEETKRKELKRKIYDKIEEEGFDDYIIGLEHFLFVEHFSLYYPGEKWERDFILL